MDRLLVVTPREVRFNFEIGKKAYAKIRLQNLMHTMPVAFKVFTTAPSKYSVHPQAVIIPPLGEYLLEIGMAAQNSFPENLPHSHDKLHVKSLVVPTGKATQADLNKWFGTRKKHVFTDATLKIVFTGSHVLWRLAINGSMECVKEVLRDTHANARDNQNRTALFIAAVQGNLGAVKALIASKGNVNDKDYTGQTPLFEAVFAGHYEIVEALLDAGAETEHKNWRGWTCLHAAAVWNLSDIMKLLLDAGANKNAVDERGRTPLHEAVSAGHSKVLVRLVQSGADIDRQCQDGCTPLHIAAAMGFEETVQFLIKEGADINLRNHEKKTPRDVARENGHSELLDSMHLQHMLQKAARKNDLETVHDCLLLGVAIDGTDQHGWTALHRAAFKGHVDVVKLLLDHQFNINMKDEKGYTPLHCAIEAGHKEVVELLVNRRADINTRINKGCLTPLALSFTTKHSGIRHVVKDVKLL